jgi:GT2 family glycosyltransferase
MSEYLQTMRKIVVVTVVYRRFFTLKKFVDCIAKQTHQNYLLVLVNDGWSRDIDAYARKNIKNLTILNGNGKLWWAGGINKAYEYIEKNYDLHDAIVLIANDDISFEHDFLKKIASEEGVDDDTIFLSHITNQHDEPCERGFLIDWDKFIITKNRFYSINNDALTTRALYMSCKTFLSIGKMYPRLLPQYLSDIEYSYRAKMKGLKLAVSRTTKAKVNIRTTGLHQDFSPNLKMFLYNHLINKRTSYNVIYWGNFVLLACPNGLKLKNYLKVYYRFYQKLKIFIFNREKYLRHKSIP